MRAVSFKAVRLHFRLRLIVPPGPLIVLCVSRAAERPIGRATMHTARPRPRIIDGRPWLRRGMLMLAPWLLLPPCVSGSEFRRNPRRVLETFACLACYAIVIGLVASLAPLLLLPIGLAAACVTLIALNYTRPSYSMRRGAPAGGLPLLDAVPSTDDPDFFVKRAARHGPVFKALSAKMPTVCVVGLPLALKVLRENEAKLHPTPTTFAPLIPRDLVRSMEPADHRHYRRILQDAIRDEAVYACQPEIDAIVASGLSALADASAARGNDGIHARAHLESLVTLSMLRLFVGLTPGSADAEDAAAHLAVIGEEVRGRRGSRRFRAAELAAKQIVSIIRRQESAVLRAVASGREPPPSFLATLLREYPNALDDPTISANFAFLLRTTTTDLTGLLHWIVKMLGDNNDCLVALRARRTRAEWRSASSWRRFDSSKASTSPAMCGKTSRSASSLFRQVGSCGSASTRATEIPPCSPIPIASIPIGSKPASIGISTHRSARMATRVWESRRHACSRAPSCSNWRADTNWLSLLMDRWTGDSTGDPAAATGSSCGR